MFKLSFATLRYASYIHFVGNVKANQNRQREHQKRLYAALREEWEIPPPLKSFSPKWLIIQKAKIWGLSTGGNGLEENMSQRRAAW